MSDGDWSELVHRPPQPRLGGLVLGYEGWYATSPMRQRTLPSGTVPLIVNLGQPILLHDPRVPERPPRPLGAFVAGLSDGHGAYEYTGPSRGVQVNLAPMMAHMLLGVPMHELANRAVELGDVFGPSSDRLVEQLDAAPDWDRCFDLLEEMLAARLTEASGPSPDVRWAWRQLVDTRGRASIGALAEGLGRSRKHLIAQFRTQVGLPPKTVARIFRFQHALDRLGTIGLAELAYTCGYYDQAHLNRDLWVAPGSPAPAPAPRPNVLGDT